MVFMHSGLFSPESTPQKIHGQCLLVIETLRIYTIFHLAVQQRQTLSCTDPRPFFVNKLTGYMKHNPFLSIYSFCFCTDKKALPRIVLFNTVKRFFFP